MEPHLTKPLRRKLASTTSFHPPPPPEEEVTDEKAAADNGDHLFPKPAAWVIKIIAFQVEIISYCLSCLSTPLFSFLSMASESLHRADVAREKTGDVVHAASRVPSRVAEGGELFFKKLGFGFLGAVYVGLILVAVMCVSAIIGVGLVRLWVEEPVIMREAVHFDYTEVHPTAVSRLGDSGRKKRAIPVGHTFYVSLVMLMPESDFNRQIGVFQVTAEIISATGNIIARSSQPCMLRFRSLPVRLTRTFLMGVPLLLGVSSETQKIIIPILHHKEGNPPTQAIKAKLQPRAGTSALPELYTAEILMHSELPWSKELVHNWKFTFYVWTSLYVYIMLLIILLCSCKQIFFPTTRAAAARSRDRRKWASVEVAKDLRTRRAVDREASELAEKWDRIKRKRKALFPEEMFTETVGSTSASSVTFPREDMSAEIVDDSHGLADEESVCG